MRREIKLKQKQVDELYEAQGVLLRNQRTERAISDTYGPKQQTKHRRKLPGKRVWKDKEKQYSKLKTQMLVSNFNANSKIRSILG